MRCDGELKGAQLEEVAASTTTPAARSRIYSDITDTAACIPRYHDGTSWRAFELRNKKTNTVSTTHTLTVLEQILFCNAASAAFTVTLPAASTMTGMIARIKKTDTSFNAVTVDGDSSEQIDGAANIKLSTYGEWVDLLSTGSAWTVIDSGYYKGRVSFTPTGSWSTNTTYTGYWWRTGSHINLQIDVALAGAPTSASLTINLPTGPTIDTTQIPGTATAGVTPFVGRCVIRDAAPESYDGIVLYNSTTSIAVFKDDGDGTISTVNATAPMTFASGDFISLEALGLPITDWRG